MVNYKSELSWSGGSIQDTMAKGQGNPKPRVFALG